MAEEENQQSNGRRRLGIIIAITTIILAAIIVPITVVAVNQRQILQSTPSSSVSPDPSGSVNCGASVCPTNINHRIDCYPEPGVTQNLCTQRGCCWQPSSQIQGAPSCFFPVGNHGYSAVKQVESTTSGYSATLSRCNTAQYLRQGLLRLAINVAIPSKNRLRIKIFDPAIQRFEVPLKLPSMSGSRVDNADFNVAFNSTPFAISVTRKSTGAAIFDTSLGGFVFEDQFLQISSKLPSRYVYGLGEHEHRSFKHENFNWKRWPMFSRDQPPGEDHNLYGVHPFYLVMEGDNTANSYGVLFLNSNAMEATLSPNPAITFTTTGGILDFYIFTGDNPEAVVENYLSFIGKPFIPPYWALGFQLSRYGYNSLSRVQQIMSDMKKYDIPMDILYGDIDYMRHRLDFTIDPINYNGLSEYVDELHSQGLHYITILDPAISDNQTQGTYPAYDDGIAKGIFINDSRTPNAPLIGKVWPRGNATFPDYFNPRAEKWWTDLIVNFHNELAFDGIWIDMNEPANFVLGSVNGCPNNTWNHAPYKPVSIRGNVLYDKTICMDALQYVSKHYDMHSLFGHSQLLPTIKATRAANPGKRSFVITRSTYPGDGQYGGHWLGDNYSGWPPLHFSIIGSLEFNIFGIPYIGADICGYFDDTQFELCLRWMQLGAFYTFSRNHNGYGYIRQDPAGFDTTFALISRDVLTIRYRLLPYLYTLFYQSRNTGATVMRPLMFEFPLDKTCRTADRQFLWGPAFLISPVLLQGVIDWTFYLPSGRWYDYYTGAEVTPTMRNVTVPVTLYSVPLHIRGGFILPVQKPANTTVYSRMNPFGLIAALNTTNEAKGSLFWDDGDSLNTFENGDYVLIEFTATSNSLESTVKTNAYAIESNLDYITVLGLPNAPSAVSVNGVSTVNFSFNPTHKVLNVTSLDRDLNQPFRINWN
ncbi:Sucrase-isomaltase, intestinal [Trichoplax sp. H2]|nr:Sucrase-isomaltase, intestinal [Trichoplax sp. H2]|eukprot:RDD42442.1 Sucrase-isomaltase, intestinal [Trichoplax sp. H2]